MEETAPPAADEGALAEDQVLIATFPRASPHLRSTIAQFSCHASHPHALRGTYGVLHKLWQSASRHGLHLGRTSSSEPATQGRSCTDQGHWLISAAQT